MNKHQYLIAIIGVLLIGFLLRLHLLDAVPLRGDEAFSALNWSGLSLTESLRDIASIEPHPPLTYVLFWLWGLAVGIETPFALRMLPVLFSVMGIAGIASLAQRLINRQAALLAALIWAIHPFQIWHAQDFRNYAIWSGLSILTIWLALRVIARRKMRDWALYALMAMFASLIFYMELITIGVLVLFVWLTKWRERSFILRWTILQAIIIAVTFIAFGLFQRDLLTGGGYGGTTGTFALSQWWERFLPVLAFGDTQSLSLQFTQVSTLWPMIITILFLAGFIIWQVDRITALLLSLLGLLPLLMIGIISTQLNIFRPRYVMMSSIAYTLILSYAALILWRSEANRLVRRTLMITVGVFWFGVTAWSLNNYYNDAAFAKAPDWPTLINYLNDNVAPNDLVIQTSVDSGYGYYYQLAEIPAEEIALPFAPEHPADEILDILETTDAAYERIWVTGRTFPDWPNAGIVEEWFAENRQLGREVTLAGQPVRLYVAWDVPVDSVQSQSAIALFDNMIELLDVEIFPTEPNDTLTVWLYWRPIAQSAQALTMFVHLVGDINPQTGTPLWTQDDHPPQQGRVNTDSWETDVIYRDVYELPIAALADGSYSLVVGIYDPATSQRLTDADGSDSVQIGVFERE